METTMKAVRYHAPGGPEKLKYDTEDAPSPPGKGEVVIRVHGVGLIWTELYWPIYQDKQGQYVSHIPGHDFSGVITAMGDGCEDSGLEVGSEVMAFTSKRNHEGAMAQYAKADVDQIVLKPGNLTLAEAATVPLSALTAWQALFVHANLQKGQKLLVTAAAGGTGVFAVQFAKQVGAHVIATASSQRSRELLESFGVDEIIDYKKTELEDAVKDVDLVLECVGGKGDVLEQCFKVVKGGGRVISIAVFDAEQRAAKHRVSCKFFIVSMDPEQLRNIAGMLEDGSVQPVLDKTFPLEQAKKAFEEAAAGHVHGKIVVAAE